MDKWNGQGLPPVGEKVQLRNDQGFSIDYGHEAIGKEVTVRATWDSDGYGMAAIQYNGAHYCFRASMLHPVKSEAERKRDEAVEEMKAVFDKRVCIPQNVIFESLHDAGYHKVNELTDEQIDERFNSGGAFHSSSAYGARWARSQIMGEES